MTREWKVVVAVIALATCFAAALTIFAYALTQPPHACTETQRTCAEMAQVVDRERWNLSRAEAQCDELYHLLMCLNACGCWSAESEEQ